LGKQSIGSNAQEKKNSKQNKKMLHGVAFTS
jgi:hypothetical protein